MDNKFVVVLIVGAVLLALGLGIQLTIREVKGDGPQARPGRIALMIVGGLLLVFGLLGILGVFDPPTTPAAGDGPPSTAAPADSSSATSSPSGTGTPSSSKPTTSSSTPATPPAGVEVACSLAKSSANDVRINAVIDSPTAGTVGLGSGLYAKNGDDVSGGSADLNTLALVAGKTTEEINVSRPSGIKSGPYEVTVELWPAGKVGEDDVKTVAEATCGTVRW